ncbi:MAG: DUF3078 domain-containing protein [Paludibacteraceae bacterium]|nr:DUF3078 domain-containing protein [Paludibacteraceae bacterium]
MKKFVLSICMAVAVLAANAQEVDKTTVQKQAEAAQSAGADLKGADTGEKDWKFSGVLGLNAAATGLVNWAAGGNNNVNGVVYGRFRLLYHKNNIAWDTNLDTEYGLTWIDQQYDPFQKSSDKLNLTTKFGWEFKPTWYLTALAGFQSQFAYGRAYDGTEAFDPIISKFMAPSYTDISVGIDWKPNDIFSVYLSPIAGRITTVCVGNKLNNSYKAEHGVDLEQELKDKYAVFHYAKEADALGNFDKLYDRNVRAELGLSFKGSINYSIKDLKISTSLGLFTPYAWDKQEVGTVEVAPNKTKKLYRDNNRRFGNFDVDWDCALSYQFFNCLQVTLSTSLKYYNGVMIDKVYNKNMPDEAVYADERVQFKGVLGIGVGYSF